MYVQVEKPKENKSRAVVNSVAQKKNDVKQGSAFVDNRPLSGRAAIIQRIERSKVGVWRGETLQLVNKLTMHQEPYDTRLAGGGKESNVDTGLEVNAVIESGNLKNMKDSLKALRLSIQVRSGAPYIDVPHQARIDQEKSWVEQLEEAIEPLEEQRLKRHRDILRGSAPKKHGQGQGLLVPKAGPVWGGQSWLPQPTTKESTAEELSTDVQISIRTDLLHVVRHLNTISLSFNRTSGQVSPYPNEIVPILSIALQYAHTMYQRLESIDYVGLEMMRAAIEILEDWKIRSRTELSFSKEELDYQLSRFRHFLDTMR